MSASTATPADLAGVASCAEALHNGGVAVFPTDTVYGLGASIFREDAIRRVFEVKHRPRDAAMPVLIATATDLTLLVGEVPPIAWKLINRFWPGPLTLVLPSRPSVSPIITGGSSTVAVRVPAAPTCLRLLEMLGEPLIGTSANRSGAPPATSAQQALLELGDEIDIVLEDDLSVSRGIPSTVVSLTGDQPVITRRGSLATEAIREAVGVRLLVRSELTSPYAPG